MAEVQASVVDLIFISIIQNGRRQNQSELCLTCSIAYRTGVNCWLPPEGPVQQTRLCDWRQQIYVLSREFRVFRCHWQILVQSKGVGPLTSFIHFTAFSYAFSAAISVPEFYWVWPLTVVLEILICIAVTQRRLLFVVQNTYYFRGMGICSLYVTCWPFAVQWANKASPFFVIKFAENSFTGGNQLTVNSCIKMMKSYRLFSLNHTEQKWHR